MSAASRPAPPPAAPRPRRGRPAADGAERRARIMAAAVEQFTARGYGGATMAAISNAAGVTKRTVYQTIGDKDALFRETCAVLCARGGDFHFDHVLRDLALPDILLRMAETVLDQALSPDTVGFTRAIGMEAARFPALVSSVMDAGRVVLNKALADVFAELVATGRIRAVEPSHAADVFYDAVVGARGLRALLGYEEPYPSVAELSERIDMLVRGYLDPAT